MAEQIIQDQLLQATKVVEDQIDAEIAKLESMDQDDLEVIRQRRLEGMKKQAQQREEWLAQGHGQYFEVKDEKEFFAECKKSKNVVCHFYRDSTFRCKIIDKHLALLAPKHIETKFIKIDAEKSKYLVERLRIVVLPTICLAKDGKTIDYIVGFDDLGGSDEFPTEMLEWRIARADVINYSGDLMNPPGSGAPSKKQSILGVQKKKTIRGGKGDDSSDEDDW